MVTTTRQKVYTLDMLRDEAKELLYRGKVERQQPIYTLYHYLLAHEWKAFEKALEVNDFLPRDPIIDLLSQEHWEEDL